VLSSFLAYVHDFLTKNNQSHYWLTIRASKGSDEFKEGNIEPLIVASAQVLKEDGRLHDSRVKRGPQ
jgi:hypothetical protein